MTLLDEVRSLIGRAAALYEGGPAEAEVTDALARLDEPLRIAIAGNVKAGKSTLLNALIGEQLAPTDASECTRLLTWYRDGPSYSASITTRDGGRRPARFTRDGGALDIELDGVPEDQIDHIEVQWPSARLRTTTLIDTPGIDSISTSLSHRTLAFLTPDEDRATEADAVVYLLRHLHPSDLRFLEAFHDDALAQATPVNAVGVLSRADEVGVCRLDAMHSAREIAARYAADDRLRRCCQTVVPVAGLLAQAACGLSEADMRALRAIVAIDPDERADLLLTSDRVVEDDPTLPLTAIEREDLLDRLGLFGVRAAVEVLAVQPTMTGPALAVELQQLSGVDELRSVLVTQFSARASTLKARSALNALDAVVARHPHAASARLAAESERIRAADHELVEIRLLNLVRAGAIPLRPRELEELERLVSPGDAVTRLGISQTTDADLREAATDALTRWQSRGENPLLPQAARHAARAAVRTCEGLLAELSEQR